MPPQFVFDVVHFKISRDIWKHSKSRKVVGFIEGCYKNAVIKSNDCTVHPGTQFCIPHTETLTQVRVHFFFVDGLLTVDIGTSEYNVAADNMFVPDGSLIDIRLNIVPHGSKLPVGRVLAKVSAQYLFEDEPVNSKVGHKRLEPGVDFQLALPDFRFKRLSRAINWQRLRGINIEKTVERNDIQKLLTCLDDVTVGDASDEEVDPQLFKALQMAQYGSQYLLSCRKAMKDREKVLKAAIETFDQEEELLDFKIAKLRARDRALRREAADLDVMAGEYAATLKDLNPRLLKTLYRTYKEKLKPMGSADEEGVEDGSGSSQGGRENDARRQNRSSGAQERGRAGRHSAAADKQGQGRLSVQPRSEAVDWQNAGRKKKNNALRQPGDRGEQTQGINSGQHQHRKGWHSAVPAAGRSMLQHLDNDQEESITKHPKKSSFVAPFEEQTLADRRGGSRSSHSSHSSRSSHSADPLEDVSDAEREDVKPSLKRSASGGGGDHPSRGHRAGIIQGLSGRGDVGGGRDVLPSIDADAEDLDASSVPRRERGTETGAVGKSGGGTRVIAVRSIPVKVSASNDLPPLSTAASRDPAIPSLQQQQKQQQVPLPGGGVGVDHSDSSIDRNRSSTGTVMSADSLGPTCSSSSHGREHADRRSAIPAGRLQRSASDGDTHLLRGHGKPSAYSDENGADGADQEEEEGEEEGNGDRYSSNRGHGSQQPHPPQGLVHTHPGPRESRTNQALGGALSPRDDIDAAGLPPSEESLIMEDLSSSFSAAQPQALTMPHPSQQQQQQPVVRLYPANAHPEQQVCEEQGGWGGRDSERPPYAPHAPSGRGGSSSPHRQHHHQHHHHHDPHEQQHDPFDPYGDPYTGESEPSRKLQQQQPAARGSGAVRNSGNLSAGGGSGASFQSSADHEDEDDPFGTSQASQGSYSYDFSHANSQINANQNNDQLYASIDTSKSMVIDFISPASQGNMGAMSPSFEGRHDSSAGNRRRNDNSGYYGDDSKASIQGSQQQHQQRGGDMKDYYSRSDRKSAAVDYDSYGEDELDESNPFEDPRDLQNRAALSRRSSGRRSASPQPQPQLGNIHAGGAAGADDRNDWDESDELEPLSIAVTPAHAPVPSRKLSVPTGVDGAGAKSNPLVGLDQDEDPSPAPGPGHHTAPRPRVDSDTVDPFSPDFGDTFGAATGRMGDMEDDDVLLGTKRLTGTSNFGTTGSDYPSLGSTGRPGGGGGSGRSGGPGGTTSLLGSDRFERDSLGGTGETGDSGGDSGSFSRPESMPLSSIAEHLPRSAFSPPVSDLSRADGDDTATEGGDVIDPPSYDSILRSDRSDGVAALSTDTDKKAFAPAPSNNEPTIVERARKKPNADMEEIDSGGNGAGKGAGRGGDEAPKVSVESGEELGDMYYFDEFEDEDDRSQAGSKGSRGSGGSGGSGGSAGSEKRGGSGYNSTSVSFKAREGERAPTTKPSSEGPGHQHAQEDIDDNGNDDGDDGGGSTNERVEEHDDDDEVAPEQVAEIALQWEAGRAPMEQIELAAALDVYVSAVGIEGDVAQQHGGRVLVRVEFMGMQSPPSQALEVMGGGIVQPLGYSTHLSFTTDAHLELLKDEIANCDDAIAFQLLVLDATGEETFGVANVELWVMVEDSVNILRQEVELLSMDMSDTVGSALLDVKGFRLLKKCAAMQRLRRKGIGH